MPYSRYVDIYRGINFGQLFKSVLKVNQGLQRLLFLIARVSLQGSTSSISSSMLDLMTRVVIHIHIICLRLRYRPTPLITNYYSIIKVNGKIFKLFIK